MMTEWQEIFDSLYEQFTLAGYPPDEAAELAELEADRKIEE